MTNEEEIAALKNKIAILEGMLNDLLVMAISLARSDRRRHLNQAQGQDSVVELLSKKHKQLQSAMTDANGHGSHGKGEKWETEE